MIQFSKYLGAFALASALIASPTASFAGVFIDIGINVNTAPPVLPVYYQPPCPQPDLIWTPGYWAYADVGGYYWVPGEWVAAPEPGYLWTPGYWAFSTGYYGWHPGYWGRHVGFYGGVNYGYGYFGSGFYGGGWRGNHFRYNTAYVNVNRTVINNVYVNRTVINNYDVHDTRVSYNGGPRGIHAEATARDASYRSEPHFAATSYQRQAIEHAAQNRTALATVNHGHPPSTYTQAHPAYAHENAASTSRTDPFSRFDRSPHAADFGHGASTYHAPTTYYARPTYHEPAYRPAPRSYAPPRAYHAANVYRPPHGGGEPQHASSGHEQPHHER